MRSASSIVIILRLWCGTYLIPIPDEHYPQSDEDEPKGKP